MADAESFRGRHLFAHSVNVHLGYRFDRWLAPRCGVIPCRLRELETARFDRLHHGVQALGIVCHDLSAGRPRYVGTGFEQRVSLHDAVRASASIPQLFPAIPVACGEEAWRLIDGGVSDPVPVAFARGPGMRATHVVVSDCRWLGSAPATDQDTVWIRPRMAHTGTLWSPRHGLLPAVHNGEAAVTDAIMTRIRRWFADSAPATDFAAAV